MDKLLLLKVFINSVGAFKGENEARLQKTYTTEFLNSISLNCLPSHTLNQKAGCIVTFRRNLSEKLKY